MVHFVHEDGSPHRMCVTARGVFTNNPAKRRALIEGPCDFADRCECYVHSRASKPLDAVEAILARLDAAEARYIAK